MLGLRLVGSLLLFCGLLLLWFTTQPALVRLLTEAFPVWKAPAQAGETERERIIRGQMRATAVLLLLLGAIAFWPR